MPKVGVRQTAALELEPHKVGGGLQVRGAQLLAQRRVHAIAHDSQVCSCNVLLVIIPFVQNTGDSLPILPFPAVLCRGQTGWLLHLQWVQHSIQHNTLKKQSIS